jgi:hypothetical protein
MIQYEERGQQKLDLLLMIQLTVQPASMIKNNYNEYHIEHILSENYIVVGGCINNFP